MIVIKDGPAYFTRYPVLVILFLDVDGTSMKGNNCRIYVASKCRVAWMVPKWNYLYWNTSDSIRRRRGSVIVTRSKDVTNTQVNEFCLTQSTFVSDYSGLTVGLLRIPSFTQTTTTELKTSIEGFGIFHQVMKQTTRKRFVIHCYIDVRGSNVGG